MENRQNRRGRSDRVIKPSPSGGRCRRPGGAAADEGITRKAHLIPFLFSAALFLAVLVLCVFYLRMTVAPMAKYDLSPGSVPERWRFFQTDGKALTPENGRLPLAEENSTVVCETELPDEGADAVLIVVNAVRSDCVFLSDGQLVYSPSGRYAGGQFSSEPYERSGASGQFALHPRGENGRLTMIVQFQGEENRLSQMPKLTAYPQIVYYLSQYTGPAAEDALPAGIYFTLSLTVMGLFLIGLWKGKKEFDLVLLALSSLSMALTYTASYSLSVAVALQSPTVTWFCDTLPLAATGWMLWYQLRKKARLCVLPFLCLGTGTALFFLIAGYDNFTWVRQMNAAAGWFLPAMLALTLIAAALDAVGGNLWFRRFFRYAAWAVPAVGLTWLLSFLTDGKLHETLKNAFSRIADADHHFFPLASQMCRLLLILCFFQAVLELIGSLARQDAELQALALREKYAIQNMEIMRQSQEETRSQRHELLHHALALEEMLAQNQPERAAAYIRSLRERVAALPTGAYSDNLVVNAVAGHYLNLAKAEGCRVDTDIKTGEGIPMRDEDLCVLLTNILENALEACRAMQDRQACFISLRISSNGEHMVLTCENSTDAVTPDAENGVIPSSKPDAHNHGYGIPAIRRTVDNYYGMLKLSNQNGRFTVKISV